MVNDRKHHRVPLFGVAEIKSESDRRFLCKALTQNISMSGMGLYMHHSLKVGTPLSITIRFIVKNGKMPSDIIKGTVTSVAEIESYYCIGVRFDRSINAEDNPNLYPLLAGTKEKGG